MAKISINNIYHIIEEFIEEKGIEKETIIQGIVDSLQFIYNDKFPKTIFKIEYDKQEETIKIKKKVTIVSKNTNKSDEISLKKAKFIDNTYKLDDEIFIESDNQLNRVDILKIKQLINNKIRLIEIQSISSEFESKRETVMDGVVHKVDKYGVIVLVYGYNAYLPFRNQIPGEKYTVNMPIKVLIKNINKEARNFEEIIILDRASTLFIKKLLELEIPEIFENIITIDKIARCPGYKTKVIISTKNKLIDPVGSCIGVAGNRIKPILREINLEKVDFIQANDNLEVFVAQCLKPAKINFVEIQREKKAIVFTNISEKPIAIGKGGKNITLASEVSGYIIELMDDQNNLISPFQESDKIDFVENNSSSEEEEKKNFNTDNIK